MSQKKHRRWPVGLVIFIAIFASFVFYSTYFIIVNAPIIKSVNFMSDYHSVDRGFNQLAQKQADFDTRYRARFVYDLLSPDPITHKKPNGQIEAADHAFGMGHNYLAVSVTDTEGKTITDANVTVMLSRFERDDLDRELTHPAFFAGAYRFEPFLIETPGRWKLMAKIVIGPYEGYIERTVFAK